MITIYIDPPLGTTTTTGLMFYPTGTDSSVVFDTITVTKILPDDVFAGVNPYDESGIGTKYALTVISSYALRLIHTCAAPLSLWLSRLEKTFRQRGRPRRCFGNGIKYRLCSTRVI